MADKKSETNKNDNEGKIRKDPVEARQAEVVFDTPRKRKGFLIFVGAFVAAFIAVILIYLAG